MQVKPLGVIWGKFPQYSQRNTIMFDDLRRNFLMNPQSGLRIRPFREVGNRDSPDIRPDNPAFSDIRYRTDTGTGY
jgi:ubiquitin-like domain-containing CTD phosphatase 1